MKKMKKLNLNKISIVSLRNLQTLRGGNTLDDDKYTDFCTNTNIEDTCKSTGRTDPLGGGTFSVDPAATNACTTISNILTECELEV
jgi:natural product precursor